ncbi:hypothetical protein SDRG_11202 [Saprolegnia diclina VS20]|uniref:DUF6604 domain-containing protein n=1 Tax=Saprolegnia diclina (strain VS20) TaxID=1156394 RepID=T0QBW3_SAPDV|nr:hypothetical protein SDRG_11202 [Saprolegnia diclina VS20]EQC31015.1 hypothetical protein SDRG_11202 [Saprolegnia diclina VS20]|eukprot:XP_008615454.1 hypothetical protein SDRG_11202 [Saprolegnia diclina VS20]
MTSAGACGRYHRYKATTNAVFEWLHRATKPKTKNAKRKVKKHGARSANVAEWSVSQIYAAALEVVEAALPVPAAILRKLGTAIRLRHQYSLKMAPDAGHAHVLNTLRAIEVQWTPLVPIKTPGPVHEASGDAASSNINVANAFEALATDDVDDDADVWAETPMPPFDMTTFVAPVDASDAARAALLARIEDENFQVMCFLLDLDDLMHEVMLGWATYKDGQTSLLAATAITNACVHSVQVLSNDLSFAHPYLKDLDHIIALLVCDGILMDLVSDHNGLPLGTAVELVVVAQRAMVPRLRPAAERAIAQRLQTTSMVASRFVDRVSAQYMAEASLAQLEWSSTLGLNSSLVYLHRLLYGFHEVIKPGLRMVCEDGFFGRDWAEPHALAASLADLYQTFFAHILPPLVTFLQGRGPNKIEHEAEMTPLLVLLETFVKKRELSVALVFACQSLLWSLFLAQGPATDVITCAKIVDNARVTIAQATTQMQADRDNVLGMFVPATTQKNVDVALAWLGNLRIMTSPTKDFNQMEVDRAWLNPYMAGQILLTIAMKVRFSMGLATMDDIGQTRMVLHLYNALRVLDKIPPNRDLDNLVNMFERGKSVWVGGRPTVRGGFVKAHMLAWGYNASTAAALAANLHRDKEAFLAKTTLRDQRDHRSDAQKKHPKISDFGRELQTTDPAPVSRAYRHVTRLTDKTDKDGSARLPLAINIMNVLHSDYNAFQYLDLNKVGQLFRAAWKAMIQAFDFKGLAFAPERGIVDGPWRETDANVRVHNENLFFQTLLGLCDVNPDHPRILVAAASMEQLAQQMRTAHTSATGSRS